ncbi:MAG TPA: 6-carboxytetrahydropterin synthase [Blastocatellia bacterium]|nr:6-carboxytetrahydropterin synthase [Blastocatellia bacterium]
MIYATRVKEFEASHRYYLPDLSEAENLKLFGKCVSPYGHGHNYRCELTLSGQINDRSGMVINIKDVDDEMAVVIKQLDHKFINAQVDEFKEKIPTTENLVLYLRDHLKAAFTDNPNVCIANVKLYEEKYLFAEASVGSKVSLTRGYVFSAAHRLHSNAMSDDENCEVFGKCNNPYGHGHNYELEVTVSGDPDARTGMIIDLGNLDRIVNDEIIDKFDHKHLNEEVPPFDELNPTSENVAKIIYEKLEPRLGPIVKFDKVLLRETPRSFFEYRPE